MCPVPLGWIYPAAASSYHTLLQTCPLTTAHHHNFCDWSRSHCSTFGFSLSQKIFSNFCIFRELEAILNRRHQTSSNSTTHPRALLTTWCCWSLVFPALPAVAVPLLVQCPWQATNTACVLGSLLLNPVFSHTESTRVFARVRPLRLQLLTSPFQVPSRVLCPSISLGVYSRPPIMGGSTRPETNHLDWAQQGIVGGGTLPSPHSHTMPCPINTGHCRGCATLGS